MVAHAAKKIRIDSIIGGLDSLVEVIRFVQHENAHKATINLK
jgi:hypothetical protein